MNAVTHTKAIRKCSMMQPARESHSRATLYLRFVSLHQKTNSVQTGKELLEFGMNVKISVQLFPIGLAVCVELAR